ncbi:MAG: hypothetical protein JSV51_00330 [Candidatus Bathyarchaeota archaeon]|nr:MAG: hypothetical protein JSV51_00330 [Candidatus Bathyarchaeota archaeon]
MESKTIAVIAVFAALTIAFNLSPIKVPFPLATFLIFQIWEIPIVAASLLFGLRVGVFISIINTASLLILFPGDLPTGPFYNLAAVLSMLLGIYVIHRFLSERFNERREVTLPAFSTAVGTLSRVGAMSIINWLFLPFPPPVGFGIPVELVIAWLPIIGVFNAILTLYTIPIGYLLANFVGSTLKTTI